MRFGHVALRNRQEARQARFGREQVVERRIETARPLGVGQAVADGEQLSLGVVQKPEVDRREQRAGARSASVRRNLLAVRPTA